MKMKSVIMAFLLLLSFVNFCQAYSLNYTGTFTNTILGASGTIVWSMDLDANDSIHGYVNFTGLPGGPTLCAAGNFDGVKVADSVFFDFINIDTDPGCASLLGAHVFMRALLIDKCDSISGNYFYQGQNVGFYNLSEINGVSCDDAVGITVILKTDGMSVFPNPCQMCFISGNFSVDDIRLFDSSGSLIPCKIIMQDQHVVLEMKKEKMGVFYIRNVKTGEVRRFVHIN
jgi:hypothetical protein